MRSVSEEGMSAALEILDHAFIRMPCNACGETYEVPLRDVLLSHTVVRCGCPVHTETECPPMFQIRLFEREPIKALNSAWEQLSRRANLDGGELIMREGAGVVPRIREDAGAMTAYAPPREGRIRQPLPTSGT